MKSPKINVAATLTKLNTLIADVKAAEVEVKTSNAAAIADTLKMVISKDDAFTTSGVSDKVTLKRVSEDLETTVADAQDWVNTLSLLSEDTVELDSGETSDLAALLATKVEVEEFKGHAEFSLTEDYGD